MIPILEGKGYPSKLRYVDLLKDGEIYQNINRSE